VPKKSRNNPLKNAKVYPPASDRSLAIIREQANITPIAISNGEKISINIQWSKVASIKIKKTFKNLNIIFAPHSRSIAYRRKY
jgi:hypothetical protein